jgi:hypothetical protein
MITTPGKKYYFTVIIEGDVLEKVKAEGYHATLVNGNTEIEIKAETRTEIRKALQKFGKIISIER